MNAIDTINLRNVPAKKPINDLKAAFKAFDESSLFLMISPTNAPAKGYIKIRPIKLPTIPYVVPPNLLVPRAGAI